MSQDEQAFLRALQDSPKDTTAALVFADWLEERGDPRAVYVRACVAMQQVIDSPDNLALRINYANELEKLKAGAVFSDEFLQIFPHTKYLSELLKSHQFGNMTLTNAHLKRAELIKIGCELGELTLKYGGPKNAPCEVAERGAALSQAVFNILNYYGDLFVQQYLGSERFRSQKCFVDTGVIHDSNYSSVSFVNGFPRTVYLDEEGDRDLIPNNIADNIPGILRIVPPRRQGMSMSMD